MLNDLNANDILELSSHAGTLPPAELQSSLMRLAIDAITQAEGAATAAVAPPPAPAPPAAKLRYGERPAWDLSKSGRPARRKIPGGSGRVREWKRCPYWRFLLMIILAPRESGLSTI